MLQAVLIDTFVAILTIYRIVYSIQIPVCLYLTTLQVRTLDFNRRVDLLNRPDNGLAVLTNRAPASAEAHILVRILTY